MGKESPPRMGLNSRPSNGRRVVANSYHFADMHTCQPKSARRREVG